MTTATIKNNFTAGKEFEEEFAHQYRAAGYDLVRLVDVNQNRNPCDYFSVLPDRALFLELKSTGQRGCLQNCVNGNNLRNK